MPVGRRWCAGPRAQAAENPVWLLSRGLERPKPLCPKGLVVNWDLVPATYLSPFKGRAPKDLCFGEVPSPPALPCLASSLYLIKQALF